MAASARYSLAKAVSGAAKWGLIHLAHREAGNMPGKLAHYVDPQVIAHAAEKLRFGSIVVVGTNGKTTVTNLIADAMEASGCSVVCNRSGANLSSGIATALLRAKGMHDQGIFESDELWLAKSLPQLKSRYVVLLNLFRDQLDRCGEIDRIQDSIVSALASSPETVLVYNADDPLCAMVAERAASLPERRGVPSISFGVAEDMGLQQNIVSDCTMCQNCSHMLRYEYRQYGQLGSYVCSNCGFARPELQFAARDISFGVGNLAFDVENSHEESKAGALEDAAESALAENAAADARTVRTAHIHADLSGSYMVYNLLAVYTAAHLLGCSDDDIQRAISAFNPKNGRLQEYSIGGHKVLLNLAKNPTGFNQNLRIIAQRLDAGRDGEGAEDAEGAAESSEEHSAVAAFFINDKEADGHDISWIWDIDFEELAGRAGLHVLAGGIRKNDLQVRLKYAGIKAQLIDGAEEALALADNLSADVPVYIITNYTALAPVHNELGELAARPLDVGAVSGLEASGVRGNCAECEASEDGGALADSRDSQAQESSCADQIEPVVIAHLFPDLLNLYGDGGNVRILQQRLLWRGIPVEVRHVTYGETIELSQVDLVFMGGGPDGEQSLAAEALHKMRDQLVQFVDEGGPVLAICGGYQIMGGTWLLGEEEVPGLGILDAATRRLGTSGDRLIDNIALESELAEMPVIGYENHASRTYLGVSERSFGKVISRTGHGNNDESAADGIIYKNVIGTYLHGPLLSKNPQVADWLLIRALERRAARIGADASEDASASAADIEGREGDSAASAGLPPSLSCESSLELAALDDTEEAAANGFMAAKII